MLETYFIREVVVDGEGCRLLNGESEAVQGRSIDEAGVGDGSFEFHVAAVEGDSADGASDVAIVVSIERGFYHFPFFFLFLIFLGGNIYGGIEAGEWILRGSISCCWGFLGAVGEGTGEWLFIFFF